MMALLFEINGVDYSEWVDISTVDAVEALQANGATLDFELVIANGEVATPDAGAEIRWYMDDVLQFAGRIQSIKETIANGPLDFRYAVSCIDFTADLDAELIQVDLSSQSAGDSFRQIVGLVGRGFTTDNVVNGPVVAERRIDLEQPSSVLSQIAQAIEHQWYVDYNRDVHLFYIQDRAAPVLEIDHDNDPASFFDMTFDVDVSQVKNVIYLTGGKVKGANSDSIASTADGDQKFWPLNYEPWDMASTTVSVNSVPQEILLDGVDGQAGDGGGAAGQVYLCLDNWGVRFPDNHAPAASAPINIDYGYAYEPVIKVEDPVSIAYMKAVEDTPTAPSNGRHELRFEIPELRVTSEDAIWDYGQLLLLRYASPRTLSAFSSWIHGWSAGQSLRIFSTRRSIDAQFYIHSVRRTVITDAPVPRLQYQITASTSPFPG